MSSKRSAAALQLPDAVPLFAALGDATRLRLLGRLSAGGPLSITRLSEGTGVTRQAITRHLHALGRVGLVRHARRGRERVWDLNRERLERAKRYIDQIAAQWDDAAERLRAYRGRRSRSCRRTSGGWGGRFPGRPRPTARSTTTSMSRTPRRSGRRELSSTTSARWICDCRCQARMIPSSPSSLRALEQTGRRTGKKVPV